MSWLDPLLVAAVDNALGATLLAGIVFLLTRWWRNPLVAHALWLLVLIKLVAPPVVPLHWGMSSASFLNWRSEAKVTDPEPQPRTVNAPRNAVVAAPAAPPASPSILAEPVPAAVAVDLPAAPMDVAQSPPTDAEPAVSAAAPASLEAAAPPTIASVARPWPWRGLVSAAWLLGSVTYLGLAGLRIARFHRALSVLPAADERVQRLATDVGKKLGYRGRIVVRVSPGHTPPLLWAVGRPTILLPQQLVATLDEDELVGILAHEIAHLVRHDPWVRWFELLVVGLYWWHLVAWYARHALRDAEELACDALVLEKLGDGPDAYVRGLLQAIDLATGPTGPSLASGLGRKSSLQRRVEAMLAHRYAPRLSWSAGIAVGLVALAFVPLSMRASSAEKSPQAKSPAAANAETAKDLAQDAATSPAATAAKQEEPRDPLDPRLGPAADLDPRVRERYRKFLRPPYWRDENMVTVRGKTVDEQGAPITNAEIDVLTPGSGTIVIAQSNAQGEFELRIPPGYLEPSAHGLLAKTNSGTLRGYAKIPAKLQPFTVTLSASQPIEARVVDGEGASVAGAACTVLFGEGLTISAVTNDQGIARIDLPRTAPSRFAFARKDGLGMAVVSFGGEGQVPAAKVSSPLEFKLSATRKVGVRAIDGRNGKPLPGVSATLQVGFPSKTEDGRERWEVWELPELKTFTDEQGAARFAWASPEFRYYLTVRDWDLGLAPAEEEGLTLEPGADDVDLTMEFWPRVKVAGQVHFADGQPAANVPVLVSSAQRTFEVRTQANGQFEADVEANRYYLLVAGDRSGVSPAQAIVVGHESPPSLELVLGPAIRVFGNDPDFRRVRLEQSPALVYENLPGNQRLPVRLGASAGRPIIERTAETDASGNFEFFVGPGQYVLLGPPDSPFDPSSTFMLTNQREFRVSLRERPPFVPLKGKVVRRDDPQVGVAEAFINLEAASPDAPIRSNAAGEFSLSVPDTNQLIEVRAPGNLVGLVERRQGTDQITIPVGPPATIRGRVVDKSGTPLQAKLNYHLVQNQRSTWTPPILAGGIVETDGDGHFKIEGVAAGWNYTLWAMLENPPGGDNSRRAFGASHWLGTARSESGESIDLGDLVAEVKGAADPQTAGQKAAAAEPQTAAGPAAKPLDPRLGPGEWVDPQVREYLRNFMLGPDWNRSVTTIKGRVVDAQGQPAANVEVVAQTNLFGMIAITQTDERGEFEVRSADSKPALIATSTDGALVGFFRASRDELAPAAESCVIKLEPPREIDARVVDGQEQPVAGAIVTAMFGEGLSAVATTDAEGRAKLRIPQAAPLEAVFARKNNIGLDVVSFDSAGKPERAVGASPFDFTLKGARTVTLHALDGRTGKAAPGVIASYQVTHSGNSQHGLHTLAELWKFVGDNGAVSFAFAPTDEKARVNARVYESKLFARYDGAIFFDPQVSGNEYTLEFWPDVKLAGQVRFPDGRPAANMPVLVGGSGVGPPRHLTATTDAAGKFELAVSANDYYLIAAGDKQWATPGKSLVVGHESPPPIELTLGPAIRVFGRDPNLRRLVLLQRPATAYEALPRSELLPLRLTPFPPRTDVQRTAETDAEGRYEFFVGPGTYSVEGPPGVNRAATPAFTLTDQQEYDIDRGPPGSANARVKLRIVRADDPKTGVARARYYLHRFDGQIHEGARVDAGGVAEFDTFGGRFVVEAMDADEKLVALVEGQPGEAGLVVPLGPPAVVRGRLVDKAGRRFSGRVDYHAVRGNDILAAGGYPSVSHGQAALSDDGRFVLDKLAPGWTYSLSAYLDYPDEPRRGRSKHAWLGTTVTGDQPVDLGDLVIEPML